MRLVIHGWIVIGALVGQVLGTRIPIVVELILVLIAAEPVETHVHQLGVSGHYGVVCDTSCHQIIGLERSSRLISTHFNEGFVQW